MSRFRPERLRIALEPDRIALVKTSGWGQVRIHAEKTLAAALDPESPEDGLACLETELAGGEWQAPRANAVVSDRLVRYFLVDLPPGIRGVRELRQLVETTFEDLFGQPASEWKIVADLAPFANRFLACAMSCRLLAELGRIFGASGHRLDSVQPFLVREFNCWRRCLPAGPAWFAAVERGSVTLALVSRRAWHGMRTHRSSGGWPAELPVFLARDRLAGGAAVGASKVWLVGSTAGERVAAASALDVTALDSPDWPERSEPWCRDYRLALAGSWR